MGRILNSIAVRGKYREELVMNWQEMGLAVENKSLSCTELPKPSLIETIDAIGDCIIHACGLPDRYSCIVNQIREKPDDLSKKVCVRFVLLTGGQEINGSIDMNAYGGDNPDKLWQLLEQLEDECWAYVDGDRAQGELFAENSTTED